MDHEEHSKTAMLKNTDTIIDKNDTDNRAVNAKNAINNLNAEEDDERAKAKHEAFATRVLKKFQTAVHHVEELNERAHKHFKRVLPDIHNEWLEVAPSKEETLRYVEECLNDGMESLRGVKSWVRNEQFLPYVNTLEEWDEVIGGKWQVPETNYLNPMLWLQCGKKNQLQIHMEQISCLFEANFQKVQEFTVEFNGLLNDFWRVKNTDYMVLGDKGLKHKITTIRRYYKWLNNCAVDFEDTFIDAVDLGMFRVNCKAIESQITPMYEKTKADVNEFLTNDYRSKCREQKDWLNERIKELNTMVWKIEDFVKQRTNLDSTLLQLPRVKKTKKVL